MYLAERTIGHIAYPIRMLSQLLQNIPCMKTNANNKISSVKNDK